MDMHQSSAVRYRLFCRVVCTGLILLGLFLLAISIRISQFTCQRSSGQCTITHLGILPTPKITFELGYLGRALVEHTEFCCTSDTPVWYNLTIEAGGLKKSYRLLYAWINEKTARKLLEPAASQVTEFMRDPTVPEVTIRLPDNRREDFFCGLYFLVIGIAYTRINARVIFSQRLAARLGLQPDEAALSIETVPKKKLFWGPVRIWLWWSFVPWIGVILCVLALYYLKLFSNGATSFQLAGVFISLLLIYFTMQAWIIRRLGMNGFSWIAACMGAAVAIPIFAMMLHILTYQENFMSRAYSQGRLSISGLIFGTWMALFQAFTLRPRVPHASWWILFSALASETLILMAPFAKALFPQVQPLIEAVNSYLGAPLVFLFCFSAIQGAILIWMMLKTPAAQPV